ncbi:hypothetical protein [Streptomyces bacillaris]|uniref:hypothetical protein n=1 Tax=Streptomyces bacillaris TaxID=68179 RepID=UPI00363F3B29
MTATITPAARAAARARDLAYVLLSRSALHPAQDVLLQMVEHLDTAAFALETEPAPVLDGITITNTTPFDTAFALMQCQALALDNPHAGIAEEIFQYVTAPITGRNPELPALKPASPQLARQETGLLTRIALATHDLNATSNPTTRYAILSALVALHRSLHVLTASVATDNARPGNRP